MPNVIKKIKDNPKTVIFISSNIIVLGVILCFIPGVGWPVGLPVICLGILIAISETILIRRDRIIWHGKYDEERARLIEDGHKIAISPNNQQVLVSLHEQLANIEQQALALAMEVYNNKNKCEDAKNLRDGLKSLMAGIPYEISKLIDCSQSLAALKHLAFYNNQTTQHIIGVLNPQQKAYEVMQLIVKNIVIHAKWLNTAFHNEQISQETRQNCLEYLHTAINNFTKNPNNNLAKPLLDAINGISNVIDIMRQSTTSDSIEHLNTAMTQVNIAFEQTTQVLDNTIQPESLAESLLMPRKTDLSSEPSTVDILNTLKL
jgi:hypothetical protein